MSPSKGSEQPHRSSLVDFLSESLQKEDEAESKTRVPSVAIPLNQTQELSFPWELKVVVDRAAESSLPWEVAWILLFLGHL